MARRLHVERLHLDLRGVDASTARAIATRLGGDLLAALADTGGTMPPARRIARLVVDPVAITPAADPARASTAAARAVARAVAGRAATSATGGRRR